MEGALPEEGLAMEGGLPEELALLVPDARGRWVDLNRLREVDATAAAFVDAELEQLPDKQRKMKTITAVYGSDGQPIKVRKNSRSTGATTLVVVSLVRQAPTLAPRPAARLQFPPDTHRPFVPWGLLRTWGVEDADLRRLTTSAYGIELHGIKKVDGEVDFSEPRAACILFSAALVMRTFPATRQRVFALYPGRQQPDLPSYVVDGTPEETRWVSTADVRRACPGRVPEGDDTEIFVALIPKGRTTLRYVKPAPGGLQAVRHPKDKDCHPFVLAAWVAATFGVAAQNADPVLPVAFGVHPPNKGTKGAPKASKAPGVKNPKQASVKCTLSCRLLDKRARAVIERIVDNVTKASRFASHLINLHVIRLLDASQGALSADFVLDDQLFVKCTRLAKVGATAEESELQATLEAYSEQLEGGRFAYIDQGNASKSVRLLTCCQPDRATPALEPCPPAGRYHVHGQCEGDCRVSRPRPCRGAPQERVQAVRQPRHWSGQQAHPLC